MPWHVVSNSSQCPKSKPHAVVKDSDGSVVACHPTKQAAKDHMAALYANEPAASSLADRQSVEHQDASRRLRELQEFLPDVDRELQRNFPFVVEEVRDSGSGGGSYTMRGHAAVYDKWSLDLGGFRERIMPGAFDDVLSRDPHVVHTWDHSTLHVLSSTRNKTLELRSDPAGLHYWSKVAPTSYATDLRILLERGDISQSSFAFTVDEDEWTESEGVVERSIKKVAELFDVTTTAMGAYPTTDSALAARSVRSLLNKREPAFFAPRDITFTSNTAATGSNYAVVLPVAPDDTDPEDETRAAQSGDAEPGAEATASPEELESAPDDQAALEEARKALAEQQKRIEVLEQRDAELVRKAEEEAEMARHEQADSAEAEAERQLQERARWKAEVAEQHRRMRAYVNRVDSKE